MMNSEQLIEEYKYLVPITLHKMFHDPKKMAISKGLEYDDIYQFGLMGVWEATKTYQQKQLGTFRNYCIRNIKWAIGKNLERYELTQSHYRHKFNKNKHENHRVTLLSMSNQPFGDADDSTSFYDIIGSDNINNFHSNEIESQAFSNSEFELMLSKLKEKDREILIMRVEGELTCDEIGQHFGVTRQAINVKLKRIQKELEKYKGELV